MPNEELDEAELFNAATSDEPETVIPVSEVEQPEPTTTETVATTETTAEKPAIDDNAPLVPSWRLREVNEEKRTIADKLAALEAEKAQWQRPQQPQKEVPAEKAAKPDPLLDPDGYESYLEKKFEEKQLAVSRESSLKLAAKTYKDEFQEAYKSAQQKVDPALRAMMQTSDDPGETLIQWHRQQKARAEVGDDLAAYKARLRDEALKDPEFRKAAMEAWRSDAQPTQTNGRLRVEMPPSLNGASRANAALKSEDNAVSDSDLFREIAG